MDCYQTDVILVRDGVVTIGNCDGRMTYDRESDSWSCPECDYSFVVGVPDEWRWDE